MFSAYLGIDPKTGKEKRTTRRGFKTKREAKIALSRLETEIAENGFQKNEKKTYQDLYDMWLPEYEKTVKESTYVKTERLFRNHILPAFGDTFITEIDVMKCQEVMNVWHAKLKRDKTVMNYAGMIFDFAIRLGLITINPTKYIIRPRRQIKITDKKEVNFYTKDELKEFLDCLAKENNTKAYTFFYLLAYTGMRKGEAFALTWKDVNMTKGTITINKTMSRDKQNKLTINTPKTINGIREIAIDPSTIKVLKQWKKIQREELLILGYNSMNSEQLIFHSNKNTLLQPGKTRKWILQVQQKYNLNEITTHGLRHTHCSLLFEAGATIKEVQDRLGHSDIKTTMNIYAHVTENAKEETADKFAKYMQL
ncbi:site-specific integrase [Vagococcus fessus]|uniref:Site-specific integrase n=2 Tax=Vagococcus fessus TaxID=120370 RepID=A0A430A5J7_9ENTE|nr:site-specific integrase [Vagococcus fessus]